MVLGTPLKYSPAAKHGLEDYLLSSFLATENAGGQVINCVEAIAQNAGDQVDDLLESCCELGDDVRQHIVILSIDLSPSCGELVGYSTTVFSIRTSNRNLSVTTA